MQSEEGSIGVSDCRYEGYYLGAHRVFEALGFIGVLEFRFWGVGI